MLELLAPAGSPEAVRPTGRCPVGTPCFDLLGGSESRLRREFGQRAKLPDAMTASGRGGKILC